MLSHRPVRLMAAHESSSPPPPPTTQFQTAGMQINALEHNVHHAQLLAMAAGGGGNMEFLGLPFKQPPSSHLMNYLLPAAPPPPPPPDTSLRYFFDSAEQQQRLGGSGRISLSLHGTKNAGQPLMEYGMTDFGGGNHHLLQQQQQPPAAAALQMRINSRFLTPAQELLNEFCSLTDESRGLGGRSKKRPTKKTTIHEQRDEGIFKPNSSLSIIPSMDILELQRIKSKLLSKLEEVDRRYRRYGEQMRAVVESFEAVAGDGASRVYVALASAAMSKHFRCLRDGIAGQLAAVRKAMGEKGGAVAPAADTAEEMQAGTSRGETPRLKLLDQCIRQHKAFKQGAPEQHPWRPQRGLPEPAVTVLRAWLFEHFLHPYPTDADKHILARQTGLSRSQVSNWFINARVRLWKPMVEEIYMEEMKDLALDDSSRQRAHGNAEDAVADNPNPNPNSSLPLPRLPQHQLLIDSESLSSVISAAQHRHHHRPPPKTYDVGGYGNGSRSSGVSLTLGLQHHNGGGMSLSLLPNSQQHPDLFAGDGGGHVDGGGGEDDDDDDDVDDEQHAHFSILDEEAASLPYRNLMGAQLLHDLAR